MNPLRPAASTKPHLNPRGIGRPYPLPLRPLRPNRFVPPRGQKQIFLPNFVLTFLRTPTQPPHFASFLVPLNLNKLDLKSYLYNGYGVRALHVRSFIMHGRVVRDPRTNQARRKPRKKKMMVELEPGSEFVWPEVPKDLEPWDKKMKDQEKRELDVQRKNRTKQGTILGLIPDEERNTLREKARELLGGKRVWTPGIMGEGKGMEEAKL
ncbi:hypothetical protein N7G274_003101 [Stereocaulon virgatum]|uniref:Large ribosomal subunit protein uL23m n=1 Tax=Stereocaulon virgatum TaxID=373712 RepID=A0ABR4AFW3_9LECA